MSAPSLSNTAQTPSGAPNRVTSPGDLGDPLWRAIKLTNPGWWPLTRAVLAGTATIAASIGLAACSAWLIVRASQRPLILELQIAVVLVRVCGISRGLFRYLERLASHRVALDGMTELRVQLYARLAAGRAASAAWLRRGDLLARVGSDVEDVGDLVVRGIVPTLVAALLVGASSAVVAAFIPLAGLALLVLLLIAGLAAPALTIRSARLAELQASASRSRVSAAALTILDHADELVVSGRFEQTMDQLKAGESKLFKALDRSAKPAALAAGVTEACIGLSIICTLVLGLPALARGQIAPQDLAIVVLTPLAAFEAVAGLPAAAVQLYRSRAAASRIMALLDQAGPGQTDTTHSDAGPDQTDTEPDPAARTRVPDGIGRGLEASGLTCGWIPGQAVLRGVDLTLQPGQAIGIIGRSGVGKTTLLATLAGLLEPLEGSVELDGQPVATLPRAQAAASVAFIAEDAHIFATTVLENLRVVRGDISADQARAALEQVDLSAWLDTLPDGLETLLGPGGSTISGGERRRLLLARALLSAARFILLDEPGEHLDVASADRLTGLILSLAKQTNRGIMVVSHRPESLTLADEVLVVADHGIYRRGRPDQVAVATNELALDQDETSVVRRGGFDRRTEVAS